MEVTFVNEEEVRTALAEVRNDSSPIDWAGITYESGKSQKLVLLGKGEDGVSGLAACLTPEIVAYCLVRLVDKIDESSTVKFVYVMFLGENVPRMQRARISVHQTAVKSYIGQSHVVFNCNSPSELTAEALLTKVMETSGTASRVLGDSGSKEGEEKVRATASSRLQAGQRSAVNADAPEALDLDGEARDALAAVRSDADPTTWALLTYDGAMLRLAGRGTEPVESDVADGLAPQLKPDAISYALVRKTQMIDESVTTKFAFITWLGESVPRMLRAKLSAHSARIDVLLRPYHIVLHWERADEATDAAIDEAIAKASGRANHVLSDVAAAASTAPRVAPAVTQAAAETRNWQRRTAAAPAAKPAAPVTPKDDKDALPFADEEACRAALRDVRRDAGDERKTWALVGFRPAAPGKKPVVELLGAGNGDLEEMRPLLTKDVAAWALLRRTLRVDESDTTKFVFIAWTGPEMPRMLRARLGTWSGAIQKLFSPYHADVVAETPEELTEDVVRNAYETSAGRKDHVLS